MNGGSVSPGGIEARPSPQDRCAECGDAIDNEWVSYRRSHDDPQSLIQHFGGIIRTGSVGPRVHLPKRPIRDFCYLENLGAFFHTSCAPQVKLPERLQGEIANVFARAVWAGYEKTIARWARVGRSAPGDSDPGRCHAHVASVEGRRVFTIARAEWERLRAHEGKLVEVDLERTPTGDMSESASVIACRAAECSIQAARIEVRRYSEKDRPRLKDIEEYLVLEKLYAPLKSTDICGTGKDRGLAKTADASPRLSS